MRDWDEVEVATLAGGRSGEASVRFSTAAPWVVEVRIEGEVAATGSGTDLFDALADARLALDARGVRLGLNGARRDVYPSQALRQSTGGRRAYVLPSVRSRKKPPSVDIFEPAPDLRKIGTVDEQREWFERWLPPEPTAERR